MTPGLNPETLDGFSSLEIDRIIEKMKDESFQFKPARRVYIPKSENRGTRPLTIASPVDKIVQEVIKTLLEIIYEPIFLPSSHGFRPKRSCQTALKDIY